ncbi:hypothetical protein GPECTOR_29g135 [Gonium pectorale]|uniref:Uncharacterized protein n=1 Tax=Gonium pectorale TaxID=33097 RepID=A0A150GEE5_GONPE|nr:hypothetical protein GPECTOR_29g135 [Gonium pectorale]|eukprot:KXZ48231.1 hypothetical protein GPECTOR_29g135 [Gonium pectorale]
MPRVLLAARLSVGLMLHCLPVAPCVFMSSLEFKAAKPFAFLVGIEGAARLLWTNGKVLRISVASLVCTELYRAAVCQKLLERGGVLAEESTWKCELYVLHAVLMDFMVLDERALAPPYGPWDSLYDGGGVAPSSLQGSPTYDKSYMARQLEGFLQKDIIPLVAAAVSSDVAVNDQTALPAMASLPPCVAAAFADPYHGVLLLALAASLMALRYSREQGQQLQQHGDGEDGGAGTGPSSTRAAAAAAAPSALLLPGLPPEAVEAAKQLASKLLPALAAPKRGGGAPGRGGKSGCLADGSTKAHHDGVNLDDEEEGPVAELDRHAQDVLMAAAALPEALRNKPIVIAVRDALPYGASPAQVGAASIISRGSGASSGDSGSAAWSGRAARPGPWGPWAGVVEPLLRQGGKAEGGCNGGDVEERYHWHVRQPLQEAYLEQSQDRDATRDRMLLAVREAPGASLIPRFRWSLRGKWLGRAQELVLTAKDEGQSWVGELRQLVADRVEQYFLRQANKDEAAIKRLIDSLHGGVTFFRQGGGGAGGTATVAAVALAAAAGGGPRAYPLLVSSLAEVESVAHLEAIRADRKGKAALDQLLKAGRMSMADLKRKLVSAEDDQKALQHRALDKHGEALQREAQRWAMAAMPHLASWRGTFRSEFITAADEASQRFKAATTTAPEFRVIASTLQLQLRHTALLAAWSYGTEVAAADGAGGRQRSPEGSSPSSEADLGHLRPTGGTGSLAGSAVLGGPSKEALATMLQCIGELKSLCRASRALWMQPCPLLTDPRVGVPALAVVCSTLEALGFSDAAAKLRQEAGWQEHKELDQAAKALASRRKALAQPAGRTVAAGATAGGASGSGVAKSSGSSKGASQKDTTRTPSTDVAAAGGSPGGLGVHDSVLAMYEKITKKANFKLVRLGISLVRFQLRHMGDLLERPAAEGRSDPRVGFIPDDWQRRLLDLVDAGASAVVSAPTSSGKTFISSYVVRKVLDEHKGYGRVVMVVPTKVLVLQIQAQMAKDFHDVRNLPPGVVMEGVFTRDFRHNTLNSVVLVTVPQCLEILLLSPAHRSWVASIKYIVFDEVQSINETGVGDVWERSLLATSCPLLALSATIGNPESFTAWLRRVKQLQRRRDEEAARALGRPASALPEAAYEVHLIVHKERYNDLPCSLFMPNLDSIITKSPEVQEQEMAMLTRQAQFYGGRHGGRASGRGGAAEPLPQPVHRVATSGKLSSGAKAAVPEGRHGGSLLPLHPLLSVDLSRVASKGALPPELSMTPAEVLELYDGMVWQAEAVASEAERCGDDALAEAATEVRRRLQLLDPERRFHPLHPSMALPAEAAAGSSAEANACGSAAAVVGDLGIGGSFVTRRSAKIWEKLVAQELLAWACADPSLPPAAAKAVHDGAGAGGEEVTNGSGLRGPWPTRLERIQAKLAAAAYGHHDSVQKVWSDARRAEPVTSLTFLQNHMPSLVLTLHEQRKLPGIVFSFDRHGIEGNARLLVDHLRRTEARHRQRYAKRLAPLEAAYAAAASRFKAAAKEGLEVDDGGRDSPATRAADSRAAPPSRTAIPHRHHAPPSRTAILDGITFSLDPARPDPSFSLVPFAHMDDSRLLNTIQELRDNERVNKDLVTALEYGVGVHHSGLNKHYRQAVETLFRAKILQVVFATGTLALGVHMPCRSVVLAGDSHFLDALNYRQMSGRSGRRGLDTLGHVVFFGISMHRVHRLRSSPMPRLHGQMLLTPTTTLRVLLLEERLREGAAAVAGGGGQKLQGSAAAAAAATQPAAGAGFGVNLMLKAVMEPFLASAEAAAVGSISPSFSGSGTAATAAAAMGPAEGARGGAQLQMRHMLDMCLLHLLRNRLLDPDTGRPVGLAGLATHLFWTEPANLMLCQLLQEGVLGRMCAALRGQELKDAAVTLLAHLFLRTPLPPNMAHKVRQGYFAGRSSSVVELRPLNAGAEACVAKYNREAFSAVVGCVLNFVTQLEQSAGPAAALREATLPLSGLVFAPSQACTAAAVSNGAGSGPSAGGGGATTTPAPGTAGSGGVGAADAWCARRGSLVWWLRRMRRRVVACSPFAALGGRGDDFLSVPDLLISVKQSVILQSSAVPTLELSNRQGLPQSLNAWMYDFYKGRSLSTLIKDNGIREGDIWDMLNSAQGIFAAAALALELAHESATSAAAVDGGDGDDAASDDVSDLELNDSDCDCDDAGLARRLEVLSARLHALQSAPPPCSARRSAAMVAMLFRIIAIEFRLATRGIGA